MVDQKEDGTEVKAPSGIPDWTTLEAIDRDYHWKEEPKHTSPPKRLEIVVYQAPVTSVVLRP